MRMPIFAAGAVAAVLASPLHAGDSVRLSHNLSDTIEYGTIAGISAERPLTTLVLRTTELLQELLDKG